MLDSKDKRDIEIVKNAPRILEFLSDEARTHLKSTTILKRTRDSI